MSTPDLLTTKRTIWSLCNQDPITLQLAADREKVRLPITQVAQASILLESIQKRLRAAERKRSIPKTITRESITRYLIAHVEWFKRTLPVSYKDGHYVPPKVPDTRTSNGLQRFIVNYLDWTGNYGNRISTTGRQIKDKHGQTKWIKGQTKTGTGDVGGIVRGRSVTFEVKVNRDTPSDKQLARQSQIRAAGGEYFFTHSPEEFFVQYDSLT